jgi:hypothetical protein
MAEELLCPKCGKAKVPDIESHHHTGAQCFFCRNSTDSPLPSPDTQQHAPDPL